MSHDIQIADLPALEAAETLRFEALRDEWIASLDDPDLIASMVPGDMITETAQIGAYREMYVRAEINDQLRDTFLALARGQAIDAIGAQLGIDRATGQSDDDYIDAIHSSPRSVGTGSRKRYELEAEAAHFAVFAARAVRDSAGALTLWWSPTVDSDLGERLAAQAGIDARLSTGFDDAGFEIRMITDLVQTSMSNVRTYTIDALLHLQPGPDSATVVTNATARLQLVIDRMRAPNQPISLSEIKSALHTVGVAQVDVISPPADDVADPSYYNDLATLTITSQVAAWLR